MIIKGGKLSAKLLAKAIEKFLAESKKLTKPKNMNGKGKQTVKQLTKQGVGVSNIEISDKNIKAFESVARKYGVDFALKKDVSEVPSKNLVFFKSRDADALTAAFKEFTAKQLNKNRNKPSLLKTIQNLMEKVKNQILNPTKNKDRGREK